jgi:hypothetical protein
MSFEKWLATMQEHQKKSLEACEKTINASVKQMVERVIERTPVGNPSLWKYPAPNNYNPGTLKASWEINTSNSARDVSTGRFRRLGESTANSNSVEQWGGIKLNVNTTNTTITIANRQPYAWRVEYGSWSSQAPQVMLRITINEYASILEANSKKFKL